MKPSEKAYQLIRQHEGLSLRACKAIPEEKYYSIGYGHYSPSVKKGQVITTEQAETFMKEDVAKFSEKLAESCKNLTQNQYDALISLIYNIGWFNFRHSMTYVYCQNCGRLYTPEQCADRIILWVRAGGRVLAGLQRRRVNEANHFLGYNRYQYVNGVITVIKQQTNHE